MKSPNLLLLLVAFSIISLVPACDQSAPANPSEAGESAEQETGSAGSSAEDNAEQVANGDSAASVAAAVATVASVETPEGEITPEDWGFAAKVPGDSELALGLDNLSVHLDGLLESVFWQRASLMMEEALMMVRDEDMPDFMGEIRRYGGQEVVMAFGQGWSGWFELLMQFDDITTRHEIRQALVGEDMDALAEHGAMQQVYSTEMWIALAPLLEQMGSMPVAPIIVALRPTEPETALERIWNDETREMLGDKIDEDEMELDGHSMVVLSTEASRFIEDGVKEDWMEMFEEPDRETMSSAWDAMADTRIELAFGMVDGYLVTFLGGDRSQFRLADPANSILEDDTFSRLAPWQDELRFAWFYAGADIQDVISGENLFAPVFEGLVEGFSEHETFSFIGEVLEGYRQRVIETEQALFEGDFEDAASIIWWDAGFHGQDFGGSDHRFMTHDVPLKFMELASRPDNLVGLAFNGNPEYSKLVRSYVELWAEMAYASFEEAVRSGMLGDEAAQQFALFEEHVLPGLMKIYDGQEMLFEEALGNQYGFMMDFEGRGPSNPVPEMLPINTKELPFLRLASMYDVVDRDKAAESWEMIGPTINRLVRDNPFMASPIMLKPMKMKEGDLNVWFYPTPIFNDEFLLTSAISDDVMIIGTSRSLAGEISEQAVADPKDPTAFYFRFSLQPLMDVTRKWEELAIKMEMAEEEQIRNGFLVAREWLSPFQGFESRRWKGENGWRSSWSLNLRDMIAFD